MWLICLFLLSFLILSFILCSLTCSQNKIFKNEEIYDYNNCSRMCKNKILLCVQLFIRVVSICNSSRVCWVTDLLQNSDSCWPAGEREQQLTGDTKKIRRRKQRSTMFANYLIKVTAQMAFKSVLRRVSEVCLFNTFDTFSWIKLDFILLWNWSQSSWRVTSCWMRKCFSSFLF